MKVVELGHLVLYVSDVKKSAHFYRDILGWTQTFPEDPALITKIAVFSAGRTHHELLLIEVGGHREISSRPRLGLYHFGLKIGDSDDELREALKIIRENNVELVGMSDHTVTHSIYIKDPDGNEIELFIDVPGVNWRESPEAIMSPIKPLFL
jgi:catechol 2,3-dioxygenase